MSLEISHHPLAGSRLVADYLAQRQDATRFFAVSPFSLGSYRERLPRLATRFDRQRREAAAAALRPTSEAARRRLEQFIESGGAVVTTGQQAGLLGGPLYTFYKALTAVRLAADLESRLGMVVLPVFWIASEDHDWAEVNHTYLVDRSDTVRRLELGADDLIPLPMSERVVGHGTDAMVEGVARAVAGAPYGEVAVQLARDSYSAERTVADAFQRFMVPLLAPFDVLVADAADPALKRASGSVLQWELHNLLEHQRVLQDTAAEIAAAGYPVQVPILPGGSNVFLRTAYGRERLFLDGRGWISRESGARFTTAELDERIETDPSHFSPNVLLRPVIESHVFPVLAYVAGPGEMAYWAQIRNLFAAHHIDMPAVYPRASATIVEERARTLLQRIGLPADALRRPRHVLVSEHARQALPPSVEERLRCLREVLVREFDALAGAAGDLDATLVRAVSTRRNRALLEVHEVERKVLRSVARSESAWSEALDAATNHLFPLGHPQERTLNILPFLARHGPALLASIADGIDLGLQEI